MNKTVAETRQFIRELIPLVAGVKNRVALCVPYTDLAAAVEETKGTNIAVGAQNVHWAESGAFTGEISVAMLKEIGVEYVVIGHSERRQYFGETDETVLKRTLAALGGGLKPIVCVGETLAERESGKTRDVLARQISEGLKDVSAADIGNVVIAYEPVWAIGTGKTATNDEANEAIGFIRSLLAEKYGTDKSAIVAAWILRYPAKMQVVTGTVNAEHLLATAKGADVTLTREEWYEVYLSAGHILP